MLARTLFNPWRVSAHLSPVPSQAPIPLTPLKLRSPSLALAGFNPALLPQSVPCSPFIYCPSPEVLSSYTFMLCNGNAKRGLIHQSHGFNELRAHHSRSSYWPERARFQNGKLRGSSRPYHAYYVLHKSDSRNGLNCSSFPVRETDEGTKS